MGPYVKLEFQILGVVELRFQILPLLELEFQILPLLDYVYPSPGTQYLFRHCVPGYGGEYSVLPDRVTC
jgi:hypothetical protein